jgi:hypothetical protein
MKVSGLILVAALGLSTASFAQEAAVSAEKKATVDDLLGKFYANLELRHKTLTKMDQDTVVSTSPNLQLRPTLGAKFFSDKLDVAVTPIYQKNTDSNTVKTNQTESWIEYGLLSGDWGSVSPFAWVLFPHAGKGTTTYLGFTNSFKAPTLETGAGEIYGAFDWEFAATQTSRNEDIKIKNDTGIEAEGLGLRAGDDETTATGVQVDPSGYNDVQIRLGIKPTKKLDLSLRSLYETTYAPKYAAKADGGQELTGYAVPGITMNRFVASYKFDGGLTLVNEVRQYMDGLFEAGTKADATRWENRAKLIYDLF